MSPTAPLLDWARWNGHKAQTATSSSGQPPIWERYQTFMRENPHVLAEALHLARARLAAGQKRIGAKALWEELRTSIRVKKLGSYKLNNDFTALLARDLIAAEPRLERVIELRERKTRMDQAVDETTPLRKDTTMATLLEQYLGNNTRLFVYENGGKATASIQTLSSHPMWTTREHYVTIVERSVDAGGDLKVTMRAAIVAVIEAWTEIQHKLIDIVNWIE